MTELLFRASLAGNARGTLHRKISSEEEQMIAHRAFQRENAGAVE
jgi:hypothetical protein